MTSKRLVLLPALACTGLLSASATSAAAPTGYEMSVYTDHRSGMQVLAGDYDSAIHAAKRDAGVGGALSRLVLATNLCVAYTMKEAFSDAAGACDKALRLASRAEGWARSSERTVMIARALTNRGVLRVLMGDTAGAEEDFERAAGVGARWGGPEPQSGASQGIADLQRDVGSSR